MLSTSKYLNPKLFVEYLEVPSTLIKMNNSPAVYIYKNYKISDNNKSEVKLITIS